MKLRRFAIQLFSNENRDIIDVAVPEGSTFLKALILSEGIFAVYQVPHLEAETTKIDTFAIVTKDGSIPDGFEFKDILTCEVEQTAEEAGDGNPATATVVFPLFMKN